MLPSPYSPSRQDRAFHGGIASGSNRISWPLEGGCRRATQASRKSWSTDKEGQGGSASTRTLTGFQTTSALINSAPICFSAKRRLACETKKHLRAALSTARYRLARSSGCQASSRLDWTIVTKGTFLAAHISISSSTGWAPPSEKTTRAGFVDVIRRSTEYVRPSILWDLRRCHG